MLTEKDYCDKDTAFALQELGYNPYMFYDDGTPAIHLWYAQKWLRNTHNLHISTKPYPCEDGLMWMYEIRRFTPYLVCVIKNKTGFREAEEALSEGIKEAVKILKEK